MVANINTEPRPARAPAPGGRVQRPVAARLQANLRSREDIIADAKKRHADALAYLATR
jgi:hypothetical protein